MQNWCGVLDGHEEVRSLSVADVPTRPTHGTVALVEPTFFDRTYAINPHMGGEVDSERAREQWDQLRTVYERHVEDVRVLDPAAVWEGLAGADEDAVEGDRDEDENVVEGDGEDLPPPEAQPDMVFIANHALPTASGEEVVLARMSVAERMSEPVYFGAWARQQGYGVQSPTAARFEGAGDALWHPGRRLLWGGYGIRTERAAYDELAGRLDATVVPLELADERYFHLDICLLPLSETDVLVQPEAFTDASLDRIEAVFETVIEAPADEALDSFAVNGEVVDETVLAGTGAPETASRLEAAGYDVVSVETGEFLKAGGSVSCLSLWLGTPA